MAFIGVFPVSQETFKIGSKGADSVQPADFVGVAELEEIGLDVDGNDEKWTTIGSGGWQSALNTGKGLKLSGKAKRSVGDPGNDFIAGTALKIGTDCYTPVEWSFPDGSKLSFTGVISIKKFMGGKATDVAPLEFDILSHGKPTWTPATT